MRGGAPSVAVGSPSVAAPQPKAPKKKAPIVPIAVVATVIVVAIAACALVLPRILKPSFNGTAAIQAIPHDSSEGTSNVISYTIDGDTIKVQHSDESDPYTGTIKSSEIVGDNFVYTLSSLNNREGEPYAVGNTAKALKESIAAGKPATYRFFVPRGYSKSDCVGDFGVYVEIGLNDETAEEWSEKYDRDVEVSVAAELIHIDKNDSPAYQVAVAYTDSKSSKIIDPSSETFESDFDLLPDTINDSIWTGAYATQMVGEMDASQQSTFRIVLDDDGVEADVAVTITPLTK